MNRQILMWTFIILGFFTLISTLMLAAIRDDNEPLYAMIINSNIRDYDQALYLATRDGHALRRLMYIPGNETVVAQSPDSNWIIIESQVNRKFYSINLGTFRSYKLADYLSELLAFSEDSQWLYFQRYAILHSDWRGIIRVSIDDTIQGDSFEDLTFGGLSPDQSWLYSTTGQRIHLNSGEIQPTGYDQGCSWRQVTIYTGSVQLEANAELHRFMGLINWTTGGDGWAYMVMDVLRNNTFHHLRLCDNSRNHWPLSSFADGQVTTVILSPHDNQLYLITQSNGSSTFFQIHPDGTIIKRIAEDVGNFIGWSDDPDWVIFLDRPFDAPAYLYRLHIHTGERHYILENVNQDFVLSPNNHQLLYNINSSAPTPRYYLIDADGQNRRKVPTEEGMRFVAWSPDDEWLYFEKFGVNSSELFRIHADTLKRETVHQPDFHNNRQPIFQTWITLPKQEWIFWRSGLLSIFLILGGLFVGFYPRLTKPRPSGNVVSF